jgi:hypothetical protein
MLELGEQRNYNRSKWFKLSRDPDTFQILNMNTNGQTVNIVYSGATQGWIPTSDDDVTDATSFQTYDIDFLVVAGGGGRWWTLFSWWRWWCWRI